MENTGLVQPLIGVSQPMETAAEVMLAASRNLLAAASALSSGMGAGGAREREALAEAVEAGFLRALRRDTLLGGEETSLTGRYPASVPGGVGIPGTGYGRLGATITGGGRRSQAYGALGGAIGYAVAGPVGALVGGMLGGLFGGDDDSAEQAKQQEELQRQWLNSPEGFEIQAYLYNLAKGYRGADPLVSSRFALAQQQSPWYSLPFAIPRAASVMVTLGPGAVQITGQGAEAGEQAARAFAGALGRVLRLNSVVAPAVGFGGEL